MHRLYFAAQWLPSPARPPGETRSIHPVWRNSFKPSFTLLSETPHFRASLGTPG